MIKTDTLTNYDSSAYDFDKFRKPSPLLVEFLKESFSAVDGLILSLGCGTGQYEDAFRSGEKIVGLDKSQGMLEIARNRVQYCCLGDMINLPFF